MISNMLKEATVKIEASKYVILALLFLGWCLGNIDRLIMNYAIVPAAKELELNAFQTGLVLSSFFFGYAMTQIPGGWLADRFGSRRVLLVIVFSWSLFTALTGLAGSFMVMMIIRVLFGFSEGGFFPSASKMISETFPSNKRGIALSAVLSASGLMVIVVPMVAATTMTAIGWRRLFYLIGAFGIIVFILYQFFLQSPSESRGRGASEASEEEAKLSLYHLIRLPLVRYLLVIDYCLYTFIWGLYSWMPIYLDKVRHLEMREIGLLQVKPGVAFLLSTLLSGFIIDKLKLNLYKPIAALCTLCSGALIYLMYYTQDLLLFVIYQTILYAMAGYLIVFVPSLLLKQIHSERAGSASGLINFGAQLAGIVTPMILGLLVDLFHGSFEPAFWYLIFFASVPAGLFLILPDMCCIKQPR